MFIAIHFFFLLAHCMYFLLSVHILYKAMCYMRYYECIFYV